MSGVRLVLHQFRYDLTMLWRNPQSRFFTLAFPVLLLLIFMTVLGDQFESFERTRIQLATYYVPAMLVVAVASACFVDLVVLVTALRERGIHKRRRSTPVPAWVLITARALTATLIALVTVLVLIAIAWIGYGVGPPGLTIAAVLLAAIVGSISFCCLGFAVSSFVGSEEASIPVTQAIILPLYFISGVFIHEGMVPELLRDIAEAFPVRHLVHALLESYDSGATSGPGLLIDLLIVGAWGVVGFIVAVWRFSWSPKAL